MSWNSVIGQTRVKQLLQKSLTSNRVAHAYLFYGPEGVGKDALALEFAKVLNCERQQAEACGECPSCKKMAALQHPNIKLIFALPVGKGEKQGDDPIGVLTENQITEIREQIEIKSRNPYHYIEIGKANFIKINSVREIKRESSLTQIETGKKIFIFLNAELMNTEAMNSLLKTLEEPLPNTVLLLTTSAKDQLLPTILSRCQLVQCDVLSNEEVCRALIERDGADPASAQLATQLAHGSYGTARKLLQKDVADERATAVEFVRFALSKRKNNVLKAIDELTASNDRASVERWLKLLQSWLRDGMVLRTQTNIPTINEPDRKSLENFITNFPHANLSAAQSAVERAIAQVDKNIYLSLILINLSIDLKRTLSETIEL
ncbi:MAG TPA: DNA polymerase III subunit delta' [Bacteroidota bacterium]|nr:DNA polymerase III subunit delta' [Bacteroidota bacterium]